MSRSRISLDKGWQLHLGNEIARSRRVLAKAGTANGWSDLTIEERDAAGVKETIVESMGPLFQAVKIRPSDKDCSWETVNIPHDWRLTTKPSPNHEEADDYPRAWQGFFPTGTAYYRKVFPSPAALSDPTQHVSMTFDGVGGSSDFWINGFWLGAQSSSYSPVSFDVTELLRSGCEGPNVLLVRSECVEPEGWWYEGGGIYRHVWMELYNDLHVVSDGLHFRTPVVTEDECQLQIQVEVANHGLNQILASVVVAIEDPEERREVLRIAAPHNLAVDSCGTVIFSIEARLSQPKLWQVGKGGLYKALVYLVDEQGEIRDCMSSPFGVRSIKWVDDGIEVNGKWTKIYGANIHQDWAVYGIALPDRVIEQKLELCSEMGVNAVRSAHHAPTVELVDHADRMGMMLLLENRQFSTSNSALENLRKLIRQFRNRPSVLIWGLENEEMDFQGTDMGRAITTRFVKEIKALDPDRPTVFGGVIAMEDSAYYSLTDVIGLHYRAFFGLLDHTIAYVPNRPHILDEEGLYPSTRGTYQYNKQRAHAGSMSHIGEAMMDAPNPAANAALMPVGSNISGNIAANLLASYTHPKAAGCFVWAALDYIGEPTPIRWPATTSSYGCKDLIGLPKDVYWLLRTLMRKEPLVHAFPHWTWPGSEGQRLPFRAYTNCESVGLFVNGTSVVSKPAQNHLVVIDEGVEYQPGELVVRGYKGGRLVAEHRQVTAGKPARLAQVSDRMVLAASGEDVALIRIAVTDINGNLIPTAEPEIRVSVDGPGELVGVHNGDPSVDDYSRRSVSKAFHGFLGAYIHASPADAGKIVVTATAEGLDSSKITLHVSNTETEHRVHAAADEAQNKLFGVHMQHFE